MSSIILRPLSDGDIPLVERWLQSEHVRPWFRNPKHWLEEIGSRHGAFSFITHMIAEADSRPIGFCQYYDCFAGQEHEDWYAAEAPGEMFSIDYLIGEPDCLRLGLGAAIIGAMLDMLREIGAKEVVVKPDEENTASRRALEANGFTWGGSLYMLRF